MHGQLLVGSVDVAGVDHRVALVLLPEDLPDAPDPFGCDHRAKGTAGSSRSHQRRLGHFTHAGPPSIFRGLGARTGRRAFFDRALPRQAAAVAEPMSASRTHCVSANASRRNPRRDSEAGPWPVTTDFSSAQSGSV